MIEPASLPKNLMPSEFREKDNEGSLEKRHVANQSSSGLRGLAGDDLKLDRVEIEVIRRALDKNRYNQTKTAIALGISRKQLITKMKKYNLFR